MWFIRKDSSEWRVSEAAPKFGAAVLERSAAGEAVLIMPASAGISVNGIPIATGIHVLQHKDEVSAPDGTLAYFSIEALPQVVSFTGPAARCGRCRSAIEAGAAAVQCLCAVWYHHAEPPASSMASARCA